MGPTSTDSNFIGLEWSLGIGYFQKNLPRDFNVQRFKNHQSNPRLLGLKEILKS